MLPPVALMAVCLAGLDPALSRASQAEVILVVTCAIRDNAERKVWQRLRALDKIKRQARSQAGRYVQIGVLGCMAGGCCRVRLGVSPSPPTHPPHPEHTRARARPSSPPSSALTSHGCARWSL